MFPSLEYKSLEDKDFVFGLLLNHQCLEWCLEQSRCSTDVVGLNERKVLVAGDEGQIRGQATPGRNITVSNRLLKNPTDCGVVLSGQG